MRSSAIFTTHMSPAHALLLGRRLQGISGSLPCIRGMRTTSLDELRYPEALLAQPGVIVRELAGVREPGDGTDYKRGSRTTTSIFAAARRENAHR